MQHRCFSLLSVPWIAPPGDLVILVTFKPVWYLEKAVQSISSIQFDVVFLPRFSVALILCRTALCKAIPYFMSMKCIYSSYATKDQRLQRTLVQQKEGRSWPNRDLKRLQEVFWIVALIECCPGYSIGFKFEHPLLQFLFNLKSQCVGFGAVVILELMVVTHKEI